jgi:hypothetical protein
VTNSASVTALTPGGEQVSAGPAIATIEVGAVAVPPPPGLPKTGLDLRLLLSLAAMLLSAGGTLVLTIRRRILR